MKRTHSNNGVRKKKKTANNVVRTKKKRSVKELKKVKSSPLPPPKIKKVVRKTKNWEYGYVVFFYNSPPAEYKMKIATKDFRKYSPQIYEKVDRHTLSIPKLDTLIKTTHKLTRPFRDHEELKVRARFTWIVRNVRYDLSSFYYQHKHVFENEGYLLWVCGFIQDDVQDCFCVFNCDYRKGVYKRTPLSFWGRRLHSRKRLQVSIRRESEFTRVSSRGSTDNAVRINGVMYLVDCSWSSCLSSTKLTKKMDYRGFNGLDDKYFLIPPRTFSKKKQYVKKKK